MLVLCSDGLTGEKLHSAVRPCTRGYKTAALVVTADDIHKEKNPHVGRCIAELESLGLSVDIADIDRSPAEAPGSRCPISISMSFRGNAAIISMHGRHLTARSRISVSFTAN